MKIITSIAAADGMMAVLLLALMILLCSVRGDNFEENAVNRHNYYRKTHNAPAMSLDTEMSWYATVWAAKMASLGRLKHGSWEERHHFGENLGVSCGGNQADGIAIVDQWYKSVCKYDFVKNKPYVIFSQLVWKASSSLGIGKAPGKWIGYQCTYWVAYYRPAGNMVGAIKANVEKGSFDKDSFCKKR